MPLLWKRAVMQECFKVVFELNETTRSDVLSNLT